MVNKNIQLKPGIQFGREKIKFDVHLIKYDGSLIPVKII